jgi:hypothetical protein
MAETYAPNFCSHLVQRNTQKKNSNYICSSVLSVQLAHEQNWQIENQPESFRKGDEDGDFELLDPLLATIYKRKWTVGYYYVIRIN